MPLDAGLLPCCVGRSDGLSLLPAVEMLERLPDVGTVAVKISGRSAGGQIFLPDGQIF